MAELIMDICIGSTVLSVETVAKEMPLPQYIMSKVNATGRDVCSTSVHMFHIHCPRSLKSSIHVHVFPFRMLRIHSMSLIWEEFLL